MIPELSNYTYNYGEDVVIAMLMKNIDVDTIVLKCQSHFFFSENRRQLFQMCSEYVVGAGRGEVHPEAIIEMLNAMGKLDNNKKKYIEGVKTVDHGGFPALAHVINKLEEMSTRRSLINTLTSKIEAAQDFTTDVTSVVSDIENEIGALSHRDKSQLEVITPDLLVARRWVGIKERFHSKGIYTGWEIIDKRLAVGFAHGKISVIGGRTSMGKSFFKTNLIESLCTQGVGVMNVCPEQGFDSEQDRLDAILTNIHLNAIVKLRDWKWDHPNFAMLKEASEKMATWYYTNVPNRRLSVAQIRTAIRKARAKGVAVDIVFIDLFDRLDDVNVAKDRAGTISVKLGEIERIAEEEKVHICLLVQMNRSTESKKNKRPVMSELRDCGNFEQDTDLILLLYREGYYDDTIDDNMLEVKIEKQRDGVANLWFQFMILDKQTLKIIPIGEKEKISDKE